MLSQDPAPPPTSGQVAWWPVHEYLTRLTKHYPAVTVIAGTPAWAELDDHDLRKLIAVALAGEHHCLRVETAQAALADAGRAIADAADWGRIGRRQQQRAEWLASRPWARRITDGAA